MNKNEADEIRQVVIASSNPGKIDEFQEILRPINIEILPQSTFNVSSVDETGLSFIENAMLKARHASKVTGLPVIADDSGLEVDVLSGQPGIYSARYAGEGASDTDNNKKLLAKLEGVSPSERKARFICLLVYLRHELDPTPIICQGSWEGVVLEEPKGDNGFGYDPLFYVPSERCSSAELSVEKKNRLSHRAQAIQILTDRLKMFC